MQSNAPPGFEEVTTVSVQIQYNEGFSEKWIHQLSPAEWRGKVDVEFLDLPVSLLQSAGSWTDPDVVDGWVRTVHDGRSIPPPVAVRTESGNYYLHDGNHRYMALSRYLGSDACVRVAIAVPLPGYRFEYQDFGEYGTYVLRAIPRRFTRVAQVATALAASVAATALTAFAAGTHSNPVLVIFAASVVVAAWLGGFATGLMTTVANTVAATCLSLPPNHAFARQTENHAQIAIAAVTMLALSAFIGWSRHRQPINLGLPSTSEPGDTGEQLINQFVHPAPRASDKMDPCPR